LSPREARSLGFVDGEGASEERCRNEWLSTHSQTVSTINAAMQLAQLSRNYVELSSLPRFNSDRKVELPTVAHLALSRGMTMPFDTLRRASTPSMDFSQGVDSTPTAPHADAYGVVLLGSVTRNVAACCGWPFHAGRVPSA
jgi:hypothetical protein